jgi:hypothetical protein
MQGERICIFIRYEITTVINILAVVFWTSYLSSLACTYDRLVEQISYTSRVDVNVKAVQSTET